MEAIAIHGMITLHEIPDWTDEEFRYWWCPETDRLGNILQPSRISEGEKRSRIVAEAENLITNAGLALILNNLSVSGQGNMQPLTQILSVGNGTIAGVARTDTAVAGDAFGTNARKASASFSTTGFSTTIVTNYASGDAVGTWTNIGWYGFKVSGSQNATTSAGTGALATHALFNFVKGAAAYAVNYVFTLSN